MRAGFFDDLVPIELAAAMSPVEAIHQTLRENGSPATRRGYPPAKEFPMRQWLSRVFANGKKVGQRPSPARPRPQARPGVELLEQRQLLTGGIVGAPAVLSGSVQSIAFGGHTYAYGIDMSNRQLDFRIDNGNWVPSPAHSSTTLASLSVLGEGSQANGAIQVFAQDTSGALYVDTTAYNGPGFALIESGFLALSGLGQVYSYRTVLDGQSHVQVFAVTRSGNLLTCVQQSCQSPYYGSARQFSGTGYTDVQPVLRCDARMEVFALNSGVISVALETGPGADAYSWLGSFARPQSQLIGSFSTIKNADGRIEVFAVGLDYNLYQTVQCSATGSFGSWLQCRTDVSSAGVAANADGRLEVFAVGSTKMVSFHTQSSPGVWTNWGSWTSFSCKDAQQNPVDAAFIDVTSSRNLILVRAHSLSGDVWQTQESTVNGSDSGWRPWERPLFTANGPSYTDVHQTGLSDCYLIAALAEVAARSPGAVENMFLDNGDGTVTVRLYPGLYLGSDATPRYVTVDTNLGLQGDQPISDLWVAVAEQAYAQAFNVTVPQLGGGGDANVALSIIAGVPASVGVVNANTIAQDWLAGKLICLSTPATASGGPAGCINGVNIVSNHWYAMVNYDPSANAFSLFNPWGVKGGSDNGVFCDGSVLAPGDKLASVFQETGEVAGAGQGSHAVGTGGRTQQQVAAASLYGILRSDSQARKLLGWAAYGRRLE
jgi:hypothetical protein